MRTLLPVSLAVLLGATATSSNLAHAVCTPTLTYSNTKLTVGFSLTENVLFIPGTTTAVGVATRELYDFDTTATTGTIAPNVRAGNAAAGTWIGDQANGANARFTTKGGIMKPDGTMVYFSTLNALARITLSGNYPVAQFAGDQAASGNCAEGDGTAARLFNAKGPAIADATGDTLLVPVKSCMRLVLVATNSPHTVTWKVGSTSSAATAAGYGTSATINSPIAVTSWGNRFYASDASSDRSIVSVDPAANWQLVIITTGSTPQATANNIPFDSTYHSCCTFLYQGGFSTWSNCWLQIFQRQSQVGHIVDPEGGNMFLLAGIASSYALFASADLNGNVWVSGHAGTQADLGKYSIAYSGCPAMSPHKCKWGYTTATATLPAVPPRTRTATPPMTTLAPITTPAPMTTGPATTTAVSASTSASSGSSSVAATTAAATISAATSAAATTAASTTAAATSPTAAASTTAAAGSTTSSSSSASGNGNGASSVTAVALGLMTMVLVMF